VRASIGGGAPLFYDHERKTNRYAGRRDFLATIRLAEGLSSVATMGNGVHCLKETTHRIPASWWLSRAAQE
jgi:hypothetical protein